MRRLLCIVLFWASVGDTANILGIFNHPAPSHTLLGKILLRNLAKRGHHVTMISSFPLEKNKSVQNYTDIHLPELLIDLERREKMHYNKDKIGAMSELKNLTVSHVEMTFANPEVKKLLKSDKKFDLVIMDWFFNEGTLMFGEIYDAPVIYISSFGNNMLLREITGNSWPLSYVPGGALPTSDEMSFKHRFLMNFFDLISMLLYKRRSDSYNELLTRHFVNPPTVDELKDRVALVLSNSHYSFESPRPYTPNIIPIGGMHLETPEFLNNRLRAFLEAAKDGVIYFSLGTQVKSNHVHRQSILRILKAFERLPQMVIYKYESGDLDSVPPNVLLTRWAPQTGILAHPRVKLFITHGGVSSMIEAIHSRVPMITVPFFGDQLTNAAFIESRGFGKAINLEDITEDGFYDLIQDVMTNPRYREAINYHSDLLRNQPIKPIDNAVFWVEHVLKHKHTRHLKPFSLKLPWYQWYLLDVIAACLAIFVIFLLIVVYLVRFVLFLVKICCRSSLKSKTE